MSQAPTRNRKVRAGMVFVLVLAATALIGWGGLAAWQAVTQNGGTAITLGVHHSNTATITGGTGIYCTDQQGPCGAVFNVTGIKPGYGPTQVGTVAITNIGSEASTFTLQLTPSAPPIVTAAPADPYYVPSDTTLCSDLQLTIADSEGVPFTVYSGSLTALPTKALVTNQGQATWLTGDTNTYKFSLSLPSNSPTTDEDSTCTASFTWGQNGA
ncbi:MAG TPA: hypothetical protein VEK76_04365 [Candidatus Binatia bacterium]|nr:hypothetical protein [Candidatus Binatia bacterium]